MTPLTETWTTAEVATSLGASQWFIYRLVKRGVVAPMRLGDGPRAPMRFTPADVEQLMDALRPPEPMPRRRRRTTRRTA